MARNYAALPHEYLEEMAELDDGEFGRLARALLKYSAAGEVVELPGNERFYYRRVIMQEDRFQEHYEELAAVRSEAGRKAAAKRWAGRDASSISSNASNANTKTETKIKTKTKTNSLPAAAGKSTARGAERMRREARELEELMRRERDGA